MSGTPILPGELWSRNRGFYFEGSIIKLRVNQQESGVVLGKKKVYELLRQWARNLQMPCFCSVVLSAERHHHRRCDPVLLLGFFWDANSTFSHFIAVTILMWWWRGVPKKCKKGMQIYRRCCVPQRLPVAWLSPWIWHSVRLGVG